MKCCNKDLGKGAPYVMLRYWCEGCKTEHLVHAREMTEYLAAQVSHGPQQLPDLL
jgi:hypothetical protein